MSDNTSPFFFCQLCLCARLGKGNFPHFIPDFISLEFPGPSVHMLRSLKGMVTKFSNNNKKKKKNCTFRSTKASANIAYRYRPEFSHMVGLLGDCIDTTKQTNAPCSTRMCQSHVFHLTYSFYSFTFRRVSHKFFFFFFFFLCVFEFLSVRAVFVVKRRREWSFIMGYFPLASTASN